jgi:hypothetical protein
MELTADWKPCAMNRMPGEGMQPSVAEYLHLEAARQAAGRPTDEATLRREREMEDLRRRSEAIERAEEARLRIEEARLRAEEDRRREGLPALKGAALVRYLGGTADEYQEGKVVPLVGRELAEALRDAGIPAETRTIPRRAGVGMPGMVTRPIRTCSRMAAA